jgi:DNA-binding winged helix-turn-helix (wHTH) protein
MPLAVRQGIGPWGEHMNLAAAADQSLYPQAHSASSGTPLRRYVRFGSFHLDLLQQELFKDGSRVRVQGKVCEALLILVESPGEVVTRETLRARLWPTNTQINYDANVNTTVNKLRQVLGDSPDRPAFVETIPRKGYTFIANVELVEKPAFDHASNQSSAPQGSEIKGFQAAQLFSGAGVSRWFTAGVVALLIAGMLFGAAVMLYAHRAL